MIDIINFTVSAELIDNGSLQTQDGSYTNRKLIKRIKYLTKRITDSNQVFISVIESFTPTGIVEVYNDLGIDGFDNIINDMILHECKEKHIHISDAVKETAQ